MSSVTRPTRRWTTLDVFYYIGVILKGVDGAIELVVGLILLITPSLADHALRAVAAEAAEGTSSVRVFIAGYLNTLDVRLMHHGLSFLVLFLLLHGVVKLVLVYCLLRRLHHVYPYAIAVLGLFLIYQVYKIVTAPTVFMIVFTVVDAVIIYLVYKEYREIRPKTPASESAAAGVHER